MADFDSQFIREAFFRAAGRRGATFAGRAKGRGPGMVFVVSGFEPKGLLFDRGRFAGAYIQTDLAEVNRRLARELANHTAEVMQAGLKRPKVSTKRLYHALKDPGNRYSDQFGFGVGDPQFLDRSEAKYWRQIDQGFTGHMGREITGVWGESLTGAWREARSGPYPLAGEPITQFGANNQGRLIPMGRKWALRRLRKGAGLGTRGARNKFTAFTRGVINNPIEPQSYFEEAWMSFNVKERYMEELLAVFNRSGGIPTSAWVRFQAGQSNYMPPPSRRFRSIGRGG